MFCGVRICSQICSRCKSGGKSGSKNFPSGSPTISLISRLVLGLFQFPRGWKTQCLEGGHPPPPAVKEFILNSCSLMSPHTSPNFAQISPTLGILVCLQHDPWVPFEKIPFIIISTRYQLCWTLSFFSCLGIATFLQDAYKCQ